MTAQQIMTNVKDKLNLADMDQAKGAIESVMSVVSSKLDGDTLEEMANQLPAPIDSMLSASGLKSKFSNLVGGAKEKMSDEDETVTMVESNLENHDLGSIDSEEAIKAVLSQIKESMGSAKDDISSSLSGDLASFWKNS